MMKSNLKFEKWSPRTTRLSILACSSLVVPVFAEDFTWQPTTGTSNWVDAANWDPAGGPPVAGDNVFLNIAGSTSTAQVNGGDSIAFAKLDFDTGFINMSGGSISATQNQEFGSSSGAGTTDELTVSGGGTWTTAGRFYFGYGGSTTNGTVTGAGSELSSQDYFVIGAAGSTGNLTLDEGAQLNKLTGVGQLIVGDGGAAVGTLTVNDGSSVLSGSEVKIGWNGAAGTLTLNDTATLNATAGAGRIGFQSGATGLLVLNGDTSASFSGELDVGRDQSSGTLEIHDTADVSVGGNLIIARNSDTGQGALIMDGTATTLSIGGGLKVGHVGANSVGSMTLSGGSTVSVTGGEIYIGDENTTGNLTMSGDSSLSVFGGGRKFVVSRYDGSGTVVLSDNASITTEDADIVIAENDEGELTLNDNATLSAGNGFFYVGSGAFSGAARTAPVGILTINGGVVNAYNSMMLGRQEYGTGTVNFNGGRIVANRIEEPYGTGMLNLNGGTIQANGSRTDYFAGFEDEDIDIQAGGLSFDTAGSDVGITQVLSGDGGLTKLGGGTLTLAGGGDYLGSTSVAAGILELGNTLTSDITVNDGGAIAGEAAVTGDLVLGSFGGADIYIDGATAGALSVENLTVNGLTYVHAVGFPAVSGAPFDVVSYSGTLTLSDSLVNSFETAPGVYRYAATFADTGSAITMSLPAGDTLVWQGADLSNPTYWDLNGTANWKNTPTDPDVFYSGDHVVFDDTAVGKTVQLESLLSPASITFNNSAGNDYTFEGGGGVGFTGAMNLVKNGTGVVALKGYASDYTGTVTINDGVLRSNGAHEILGHSSGIFINDSVNGGGQLDMNGNPLGNNVRSYDFTIAGSGPDGLGAITNSSGDSPNERLGVLNLTLSGDASVGGNGGRFDIGLSNNVFGSITGNGHTLTKVGTGTVAMRAPATDITYVVNGGFLKFENHDTASGPNAITLNAGGGLQGYGDRTFANTVYFGAGCVLDNDGGGTQTWSGPFSMTGTSADTVNLNARNGAIIQSGGISGASNVSFNGGNTFTLAGSNTYSGDTTVTAGTLALAETGSLTFVVTDGDSNRISGSASATFSGTFNIDTSAVGVSSGTWSLVDTASLNVSYDASFTLGAGWTESEDVWTKTSGEQTWTFTEATGELTLGEGGSSYATWIDGFFPGESDPLIIGADADPDEDGIANAVEMVIGGDPATGMDVSLLPTLELATDPAGVPAGDYFLFTYRRSDLSSSAGLSAVCEYGVDLSGGWTSAQDGVDGVVVLEDDNYPSFVPPASDTDRIRVYIPRGSNPKMFGRLSVVVP